MSQPAMSNALNRLRYLLKDQVFLRTAEGMRPTARARELGPPITQALKQIQEALEPATLRRRRRLRNSGSRCRTTPQWWC